MNKEAWEMVGLYVAVLARALAKQYKKDIYLFCSDGLSDMVADNEIFSTLVKTRDNLERASSELVALAKEKGGKDNISVILVTCK